MGVEMAADQYPSYLTGIAIPVTVWVIQQIVQGIYKSQQDLRTRFVDTQQLLTEVEGIVERQKPFLDTLEKFIVGSPSDLDRRLSADPKYYIFTASGDSSVAIFQGDVSRRFSHLDSETFKGLRSFYDTVNVIDATHLAIMTDNYKNLLNARKKQIIIQLKDNYDESIFYGEQVIEMLRKELIRITASWRWRILRVGYKNSIPPLKKGNYNHYISGPVDPDATPKT